MTAATLTPWVPVVTQVLDHIFGGSNKEAERARQAADEARKSAAEMKTRADNLQNEVEKYRESQNELRDQLQREMDARSEQDEKHNAAMREMEQRYNAQREEHKEEMKAFRQEALESEKRLLGERLDELTKQRKQLDRLYETHFGAMEQLALQVKLETDKMQHFSPEREDGSIKKIVLLGLTGDGKSTLANRLAGDRSEDGNRGPFKTSRHTHSETQAVVKTITELYGVKISVVDTPGISDTSGRGRDRQHTTNLVGYLRGCGGVNQFLILKNGTNPRFSDVYLGMLRELEHVLGEEFWQYATVVLTHVDDRRTIRDFESHKAELCQQLSSTFGANLDAVGIGLDDYDEVLADLVTRIVPDHKFQPDSLVSPLQELEAELAANKDALVVEKQELDRVDARIGQVKTGLEDVEQKLAQLN